MTRTTTGRTPGAESPDETSGRWPGSAACVGEARRQVRDWLRPQGLVDLEDACLLVVTELATNAVVHAQTSFGVTVTRLCDGLLVRVDDASAARPQPDPDPPTTATSGRGTGMVDLLSAGWGVVDDGAGGKVVWALLGPSEAVPGEPAADAARRPAAPGGGPAGTPPGRGRATPAAPDTHAAQNPPDGTGRPSRQGVVPVGDRAHPGATPPGGAPVPVPPPAPLRVVVVEDDHVLRTVLTAYLEGDDRLEVVRSFDGADQVLEAVAAVRPDVIVLDNQMPSGDGIDLLPRLRACSPDSTIVMWSSDADLRQLAQARGADAFIDKDAPLEDVVEAAVGSREDAAGRVRRLARRWPR